MSSPRMTEPCLGSLDQQPRIGIALGGGSARGYAHIGVLSALEEQDLRPHLIAGTSFGAVVGALYASGRSLTELRQEASVMRRRDLFPRMLDFGLHGAALFAGRRLEAYLESLTEGRHFSDLQVPLIVVATDVDTGERVLLDSGPLSRALRASVSMPGIFWPVEIDGRRLIDGGIGSPVPIDTLSSFDLDVRIGVGAGITSEDSRAIVMARRAVRTRLGSRLHRALAKPRQVGRMSGLGKAIALTVDSWCSPAGTCEALHLDTRPPISWLNFNRADEAIRAGEEAMRGFMPRLRNALADIVPT